MIDLPGVVAQMAKQMSQKMDDLLKELLAGRLLCSGACVNTAKHIEFGPEVFESSGDFRYLSYNYHIVRAVRFRCDEHWTYGEETVVYVQEV